MSCARKEAMAELESPEGSNAIMLLFDTLAKEGRMGVEEPLEDIRGFDGLSEIDRQLTIEARRIELVLSIFIMLQGPGTPPNMTLDEFLGYMEEQANEFSEHMLPGADTAGMSNAAKAAQDFLDYSIWSAQYLKIIISDNQAEDQTGDRLTGRTTLEAATRFFERRKEYIQSLLKK